MLSRTSIRRLSTLPITISHEIKQALSDCTPIVALESTIITHGLPYPQNIEMALEVEQTIRNNGAIPATCAFINGQPFIGLQESQLNELAEYAKSGLVNKVSRRDIGYVMANKQYGGTTIALTMILAEKAGIKVFATGGLGGVHKEGERTFDISADLTELGRTPVSVVCAGPKSILDIGLTMEYLETQGVFVGTYDETGSCKGGLLDIPGFYCRESGTPSPYLFHSFAEAASIIYNQNIVMGLKSGNVFCIPPPKESALDSKFISEIIENANIAARNQGIKGKQLTPFLLEQVAKETKGKSVTSNISLVKNNAKAASEIAKELAKLQNVRISDNKESKPLESKPSAPTQKCDLMVIGSIALDTVSKLNPGAKMNDSNIGTVQNSIGGVGYNLSLASQFALEKYPTISSKLISQVGDDIAGRFILDQLKRQTTDSSGVRITSKGNTAQYVCTHDDKGDLIVACADMSIIEQDFSQDIIQEVNSNDPKIVIFDCNLSPATVSKVLNRKLNSYIIIEPTSHVKAKRIGSFGLQVFPNNQVQMITPTIRELESIYESFRNNGQFEDLDNWFPVLDALNIDTIFREKLDKIRNPVIQSLLAQGIFQQCLHLIPYFQNILVKLGDKGVILISICTSIDDYKSIPTTSPYRPELIITSQGRQIDDTRRMGVLIEYFPIPEENKNLEIVNVTGAGDSFLGYLAASNIINRHDTKSNWLASDIIDIEQVWNKWECIYKAQLASGLSLRSNEAVSHKISQL